MIIDTREIDYAEVLKQVTQASSRYHGDPEEFMVFMEGGDDLKISFLKTHIESLINCEVELMEAGGYYILRATEGTAAMANQ